MRTNSPFFLARSAGEIADILQVDGDKLSPRSRTHLQRMAKALMFAAAEAEAFPAVEARHAPALAKLLERAGEEPGEADGAPHDDRLAKLCERLRRQRGSGTADPDLWLDAVRWRRQLWGDLDGAVSELQQQEQARPRTPDELAETLSPEALTHHLRAAGHAVRIEQVTRHWTQSSKEISWVVTDEGEGWPRQAAMRRERPYAIVDNSVAAEIDVLSVAWKAGLPTPRPLFAEPDPAALGGRFILSSFMPGKIRELEELGAGAGPVLRDAAGVLARLHQIDPRTLPRLAAQDARSMRALLEDRISAFEAKWRRTQIEPSPVIEASLAWLLGNLERIGDDPVIVHGDFDLRNMLVHEGRLSALLDWEFAKLGHRGEDLGYFYDRVVQAMPWAEFMEAYHDSGGAPIDPFAVKFHRVLAWTLRAGIVVTAYSGFWRAEHADIASAAPPSSSTTTTSAI